MQLTKFEINLLHTLRSDPEKMELAEAFIAASFPEESQKPASPPRSSDGQPE